MMGKHPHLVKLRTAPEREKPRDITLEKAVSRSGTWSQSRIRFSPPAKEAGGQRSKVGRVRKTEV